MLTAEACSSIRYSEIQILASVLLAARPGMTNHGNLLTFIVVSERGYLF